MMRLHIAVVAIVLVVAQIGDGSRFAGGSRGRMRFVPSRFSGANPFFSTRPRMVRISAANCSTVTCAFGGKCEMRAVTPCPEGNCTAPFCVSNPELPRVVSAIDNPGTCPQPHPNIITGSGISCGNDSSCAINQKCCVTSSSIECVNVTSVELATFSARRLMAIRMFFPAGTTMGKLPAMHKEEGFCPSVSPTAFGNTCPNGDICTMETDCPGRQQCCVAGCGKRCLNLVSLSAAVTGRGKARNRNQNPARSAGAKNASTADMSNKRGVCPTIAIDAVIENSTACATGDMDCPGIKKCCVIGVRLGCVDPVNFLFLPSSLTLSRAMSRRSGSLSLFRIRGSCPAVSAETNVPCGTACANDTSCASGLLCCPRGGCMECLRPVISETFLSRRPGICPSPTNSTSSACVQGCQDDNDCANPHWKCCDTGCGTSCRSPVASMVPMIKAGTCPAAANVTSSNIFRAMFRGRWKRDQYSGDMGRSSRFFARGRSFFGSERQRSAGDCSFNGLRFVTCASDASCSQSQKCCRNRCGGMSCTNPA